MQKNESKYFYTARLMNQALLSLLEERDIEFITVTEVTKKAGVNRSTFYLHYENIYDLLEESIENLNKEFISSFSIPTPFRVDSEKDAFLITDKYLVPYLNFVKENKRVLKLIHRKPQLFQSKNTYKRMYDTIFYPAISYFVEGEKERIYNLEFFTGGIMSIINKWIELDCITEIDELVDIIKNCIGYRIE